MGNLPMKGEATLKNCIKENYGDQYRNHQNYKEQIRGNRKSHKLQDHAYCNKYYYVMILQYRLLEPVFVSKI